MAIVNWNTPESAVASSRVFSRSAGVRPTVTVIDNDSSPDRRQRLEELNEAPVSLILSEENLGYGKAANLALRNGTGQFVCVCNADATPLPDALQNLIKAIGSRPDAGVAGPVFRDGTNSYHDRLPSPWTLLVRSFIGSYGRREQVVPSPDSIEEVEQPSGAFLVMRRELWEQIGGFDEEFFLWYEDIDLARRLVDMGRVNLVVGSAMADHQGAESFDKLDSKEQQSARLPSLALYIRKHHPRWVPLSRPLLWASTKIRARG